MKDYSDSNGKFSLAVDMKLLSYMQETTKGESKMTRLDAFVDLLNRRVEEDTRMWVGNREITLNEGCALAPVLTLSKEWGWDRKTVRRFLVQLEEFGIIEIGNTNGITITTFPIIIGDRREGSDSPQQEAHKALVSNSEDLATPTSLRIMQQACEALDNYNPSNRLNLCKELEDRCKEAYDLFYTYLPKIPRMEYNDETRALLLSSYILGMRGHKEKLEAILKVVSQDPFENGSFKDQELYTSFNMFFQPAWYMFMSRIAKN